MKKIFQLMIVLMIVLVIGGAVFAQAETKTYIVGTCADYPPFEWVDSNGNYVGLDMDLMRVIAIVEGYEIELLDLGFDSLIPALQSGKIDIIAASMSSTSERAKIVDFSDAYWKNDQPIMVREDSDLNIVTALSQNHKAYAENKHFLTEEKDVAAYAEGLAKSMTAK